MADLVLLNGPPGIGKSTLAALHAERHPGTLDLDLDRLHPFVGGWRNPTLRVHDLLRPVALAMAATHLGGGRDVVLPQYLARDDELDAFEQVAHEAGAAFREVVLLDEPAEALTRFERRRDDGEWGAHNRRLVEDLGGSAWLSARYDDLLALVERRPASMVVHAAPGAVEATYAALLAALQASSS